jgi:hypothetical protein
MNFECLRMGFLRGIHISTHDKSIVFSQIIPSLFYLARPSALFDLFFLLIPWRFTFTYPLLYF